MNQPEKFYGFNFCGEGYERMQCRTYILVDQIDIESLLTVVMTSYLGNPKFKVTFGFVKELIFNAKGKVVVESPSKVGGKKYQAFILKRNGDIVTSEGAEFFINGLKIDFSFSLYNVTIIDI